MIALVTERYLLKETGHKMMSLLMSLSTVNLCSTICVLSVIVVSTLVSLKTAVLWRSSSNEFWAVDPGREGLSMVLPSICYIFQSVESLHYSHTHTCFLFNLPAFP